jgi:hypothetical protein
VKAIKVDTEEIIVNLLKMKRVAFIEVAEILDCSKYIIKNCKCDIYINVDFNSIEKFVEYNEYLFDLFENKIYLRDLLPEIIIKQNELLPEIQELISNFIKET